MGDHNSQEAFEQFRASFSYGSRNDLNFKFLKHADDASAAAFLQELLWKLGEAYDTGDVAPLIEAAYAAQIEAYAPAEQATPPDLAELPFTRFSGPLSGAKLGMLTTSGHFVDGDDPAPFGVENMTQEEAIVRIGDFLKAPPALSEIPSTTPTAALRVRHGGYDIRSTQKDHNVSFPIDRIRELRDNGTIAALAGVFFSFTGATSQGRLRKILPEWVDRIKEEDIDLMLLVPV